jgi:signal transduction histidine kinase
VLVETGAMTSAEMQVAISDQIVTMQSLLRDNNRLLSQRVAERTAELARLLARMKDINQLKVNFLSNVSHELRTPLTQIQGYIYMLNEGMLGDLRPEQLGPAHEAMAAVDRMRSLIDGLIEYTMAARGELAIAPAEFPLAELARTVIEKSVIKAQTAKVQLGLEVAGSVAVRGDVEKLSWVLLQLIDNAIKFTPQDGTVSLRLLPDPARGKVVVEVQDTGSGIESERIPQLFEPVRQDGGARGYTGLGLGLMMVRRIVAAHDSELKVDSRVGIGSTFSFELPLIG